MKAVYCTICSREKDPEPKLIPAHQRYRGEHVTQVRQYARMEGLPFFMLSGKFGLIREDDMVPYYDYLLTEQDVEKLIAKVKAQLKRHGVRKLLFYHKPKPSWKPYAKVMMGACYQAQVWYVDMPFADAPAALHAVH